MEWLVSEVLFFDIIKDFEFYEVSDIFLKLLLSELGGFLEWSFVREWVYWKVLVISLLKFKMF